MTTSNPVRRAHPSYVSSRLHVALGTFVAIEAEAETRLCAEQSLAAAFAAIARVERTMHPHRAGSDLAALASLRSGSELRVDAWTWDVLRLCQQVHEASDGLFDPCPDMRGGRFEDLELLEPPYVRGRAPVQLDLGGIAKGYAVDRALEALREADCQSGLVNAGGDLAVFGPSRSILCRSTRSTFSIELKDAALASSDADESERPAEHRGYYDGVERSRIVCGRATVTAPRAPWADALTKCALLCEPSRLEALLQRFDATRIG